MELAQSPVTINAQKKDTNMTNERRIATDIHAETMKEFKVFSTQSTISNSAHSNSEELFDAVSDPKSYPSSNPNVATYNTNGNYPHKLLANSEIPEIIQGVIPPFHQATAGGVSTCGGDLHAVRTVLSEEIFMGAAPSAVRVFKDPPVLNWKVASRPIPIDMNTVVVTPRYTTQVLIGTGNSVTPIRIRRQ